MKRALIFNNVEETTTTLLHNIINISITSYKKQMNGKIHINPDTSLLFSSSNFSTLNSKNISLLITSSNNKQVTKQNEMSLM